MRMIVAIWLSWTQVLSLAAPSACFAGAQPHVVLAGLDLVFGLLDTFSEQSVTALPEGWTSGEVNVKIEDFRAEPSENIHVGDQVRLDLQFIVSYGEVPVWSGHRGEVVVTLWRGEDRVHTDSYHQKAAAVERFHWHGIALAVREGSMPLTVEVLVKGGTVTKKFGVPNDFMEVEAKGRRFQDLKAEHPYEFVFQSLSAKEIPLGTTAKGTLSLLVSTETPGQLVGDRTRVNDEPIKKRFIPGASGPQGEQWVHLESIQIQSKCPYSSDPRKQPVVFALTDYRIELQFSGEALRYQKEPYAYDIHHVVAVPDPLVFLLVPRVAECEEMEVFDELACDCRQVASAIIESSYAEEEHQEISTSTEQMQSPEDELERDDFPGKSFTLGLTEMTWDWELETGFATTEDEPETNRATFESTIEVQGIPEPSVEPLLLELDAWSRRAGFQGRVFRHVFVRVRETRVPVLLVVESENQEACQLEPGGRQLLTSGGGDNSVSFRCLARNHDAPILKIRRASQ